MNFFKKQHMRNGTITTLQRTSISPARRPAHPPLNSPDQAMQRVHAAAEQARKEIAELVQSEHEAIAEAIATACEEAEERLRGATERRIDSESKRAEEAESKLRRDLRRMVKAEIAKATKASSPTSNGNDSVPIRARA